MSGHSRRNHADMEYYCPVCKRSGELEARNAHLMTHTKRELVLHVPIQTMARFDRKDPPSE